MLSTVEAHQTNANDDQLRTFLEQTKQFCKEIRSLESKVSSDAARESDDMPDPLSEEYADKIMKDLVELLSSDTIQENDKHDCQLFAFLEKASGFFNKVLASKPDNTVDDEVRKEAVNTINQRYWKEMHRLVFEQENARWIAQCLLPILLEEENGKTLLQELCPEGNEIANITFNNRKPFKSKEDFMNFCNNPKFQDKNATGIDEDWDILAECFRVFRGREVLDAMVARRLCIDDYVKFEENSAFIALFHKKMALYDTYGDIFQSNFVLANACKVAQNGLSHTEQVAFESYFFLPFHVLEAFFQGE